MATNDVRFLSRDDFEAHEARVCIHQGRRARRSETSARLHAGAIPQIRRRHGEAVRRLAGDAARTASKSRNAAISSLSFGKYYLPAFPVPAEQTIDSFIRTKSRGGLATRLAKHAPVDGFTVADYEKRLETELDVIVKMGFAGYFLIVADFINWAKHERHSGRTRPRFGCGIARCVQPRHHRSRSAAPTACCSSDSSIPNACRCRTSTSTSAWTAATK